MKNTIFRNFILGVAVALFVLAFSSCNNNQDERKFPPGKVINDTTEIIVEDMPQTDSIDGGDIKINTDRVK